MRLRTKTVTKKYKKRRKPQKSNNKKKIQKRLKPQKVQKKKLKKALCHKNNKNKFSSIFRVANDFWAIWRLFLMSG